jgi:hypothetical protein
MNQQELADACRMQADWCVQLGSPFYHELLTRIAADVLDSGVCWKVLESHRGDSGRSLLPLRFLAGIHRLVLENRVGNLAQYYPSVGGVANAAEAWPVWIEQLERHGEELRTRLPKTVQTNEVTRCCALLPGFLAVARRTALPLRLLEIGCSAGLNLRWDRFGYSTAHGVLGDSQSAVQFRDGFAGKAPPPGVRVSVAERCGCDLNPVDPDTEEGRLTLLSFVWPDQVERVRQLSNAIQIAREVPAKLDCSDALAWLESQLAQSRPGVSSVVFHSLVLAYLTPEARECAVRLLDDAGRRASTEAPLAWLSFEPGERDADVDLTIWPGGERRRIAQAGYHGGRVELQEDGFEARGDRSQQE